MATVWIVDDDHEMAQAIALMVELLGHKARVFVSPRAAARALLEEQPPQAILLDLNMPVVSGDEFLKFIRSRKKLSKIRVVMLTSEFAESERERLLKLGANGCLTKPVILEELEAALA